MAVGGSFFTPSISLREWGRALETTSFGESAADSDAGSQQHTTCEGDAGHESAEDGRPDPLVGERKLNQQVPQGSAVASTRIRLRAESGRGRRICQRLRSGRQRTIDKPRLVT